MVSRHPQFSFLADGAGSAVCYCLSRFRVRQNLQCRSLFSTHFRAIIYRSSPGHCLNFEKPARRDEPIPKDSIFAEWLSIRGKMLEAGIRSVGRSGAEIGDVFCADHNRERDTCSSLALGSDIFSLKHESSIFRSFIQPCLWFCKCQATVGLTVESL